MLMALHESKPHSSAKKSNRPFEPHTAQSDVSTMPTADLRPHPLSSQIYGVTHDSRLLESVKETGILSPLLVTANGMVVSGGERLWAARESGLAEVPVRLVPTLDETDIKLQVLAANIARDKTNEQRIREYQFYQEIESEKAKTRRGTRNDLVVNLTPSESGKARDLAAAKVGWCAATAEKGSKVLNGIQEHSKTDMQVAKEVRRVLNEASVDAAYKQAAALGWLGTPATTPKETTVIPKTYQHAKAAATKLAEIVTTEEIALFTPPQIRELRATLEPLLKWIDGLPDTVKT